MSKEVELRKPKGVLRLEIESPDSQVYIRSSKLKIFFLMENVDFSGKGIEIIEIMELLNESMTITLFF